MSKDPSLDRDSFQQFLASAFAVQESPIDSQFLSAMLEIHRLISRGDLGLDGALNLIVDSAREVAGADGVAIGLLQGDELTFRAAGGCSAGRIGSRVAASLTVSRSTKATREILRVENAQTDTRVEAAICRQFGARSLLILPIYRDRALAGVFEILFTEAHAFQDCELRTYRLLAALIEAALMEGSVDGPGQFTQEPPPPEKVDSKRDATDREVIPRALLESSEEYAQADGPGFFSDRWNAVRQHYGVAVTSIRRMPVFRNPGLLAKRMAQRTTEGISHKPLRSLALAAVATAFGLGFWMAHGNRGASSPDRPTTSAAPVSLAKLPEAPVETTAVSMRARKGSWKATRATGKVRQAQADPDAVEQIGDDVTVRHFTYQAPARHGQGGANRVAYLGDDVTVRYFATKSAPRSDGH